MSAREAQLEAALVALLRDLGTLSRNGFSVLHRPCERAEAALFRSTTEARADELRCAIHQRDLFAHGD